MEISCSFVARNPANEAATASPLPEASYERKYPHSVLWQGGALVWDSIGGCELDPERWSLSAKFIPEQKNGVINPQHQVQWAFSTLLVAVDLVQSWARCTTQGAGHWCQPCGCHLWCDMSQGLSATIQSLPFLLPTLNPAHLSARLEETPKAGAGICTIVILSERAHYQEWHEGLKSCTDSGQT